MELYYQIALKSVPFDNSYKNVLRFDNRSEQEAYFETNTLFSNSPRVNFNVGSFYATNVIYDCAENKSISELLNKNYCIIKDNNPNRTLNYYYYFITNAMQDCDNRIKLSLELDIFQTYYIDLLFGDGVVYKAHLDRFVENSDGTVSFDGRKTSKLFEREEITNVAKRLTNRYGLSIYSFNDYVLNNWLEQNIFGWLYLFVDSKQKYNMRSVDGNEADIETPFPACQYMLNGAENIDELTIRESIDGQLTIFCVPVYKKNVNHIRIKFPYENDVELPTNYSFNELSTLGIENFLEYNNGASHAYSYKFSNIPPFYFGDVPPYEISEDNDLILNFNILGGDNVAKYGNEFNGLYACQTRSGNALLNLYKQNYQIKVSNPISLIPRFEKSEIIGSNKNYKFNPKLISSDYKDLRLVNHLGDFFNYDLQKLNSNQFDFLISAPIVPDIDKQYIRILPPYNSLYESGTAFNLTGLITQNDDSLVLISTAYQTMLANNKNYFVQNAVNRELNRAQRNVNTTMGILGDMFNPNLPKRLTSVATEALDINLDYTRSVIQEKLTVDNLQNAPSAIQGAKGNCIFSASYTKPGYYLEIHDILENEKEMINDFMCLYGFTYNRVDNVKNVDNIRKIYNYVRADIETISGMAISETVHKKFRQCFANGVRFWNTDTFNYDKENYERWLENE